MKHNRTILLLWVILAAASFGLHGESEQTGLNTRILILPFTQENSPSLTALEDLLPELISNSLSAHAGFSVVKDSELRSYFRSFNISPETASTAQLTQAARYFEAGMMLSGEFEQLNTQLEITLNVYDFYVKRQVYRSTRAGKGGIDAFDTAEALAVMLSRDFSSMEQPGIPLSITSESPCRIYLDDVAIGESPIMIDAEFGRHHLKAVSLAGENAVYSTEIFLGDEWEETVFIPTTVPLVVHSDEPFQLYLNQLEIGATPFEGRLPIGEEMILVGRLISNPDFTITHEFETVQDGTFDFEFSGKSTLVLPDTGNGLQIRIPGLVGKYTPFILENLQPGHYSYSVYLQNPATQRDHILMADEFSLLPGQETRLDLSQIDFQFRPDLIGLPGVPQFYNKDSILGSAVIAGITAGLSTMILAPILASNHYNTVYVPMAKAYIDSGTASGYTPARIQEEYKTTQDLFIGLLAGGAATTALTWLFSILEGAITMKNLEEAFQNQPSSTNPDPDH